MDEEKKPVRSAMKNDGVCIHKTAITGEFEIPQPWCNRHQQFLTGQTCIDCPQHEVSHEKD